MTVSGALTSPRKNAPSGNCPLTTSIAGSVAATSGGVGVGGSAGGATLVLSAAEVAVSDESASSVGCSGVAVAGRAGSVGGTAVFTAVSVLASCWTTSVGTAGSLDSAPLQAANSKVIHTKKSKTYFMQLIIA